MCEYSGRVGWRGTAYRKYKKKELHSQIKNKKKIYLDLNFWINLRDVSCLRSDDIEYSILLEKLRELVKRGSIICPISEIIFLEIIKQSGEPEFNETIKIIEELSQNIIIENEQHIAFLVYYQYFLQHLNIDNNFNIDDELWTWIIDIFGHKIPPTQDISSDDTQDLLLYKSYVDYTWNKSLTDIININSFGQKKQNFKNPFSDLIDNLNSENPLHNDDYKSFQQLYDSEMLGILDSHKIIAWKAFELVIHKNNYKITPKESYILFEKYMRNIIKDKLNIPGIINIPAGLHSLFRYENRIHKESNDIFDYHHSYAAVPFFDYFFTEKKLSNIITHPRLKFNDLYNCKVKYKIKDVLEVISADFDV